MNQGTNTAPTAPENAWLKDGGLDVDTWDAFEQDLNSRFPNGTQDLLFRGQADSRWHLQTTLERAKQINICFIEYYRIIFTSRPEVETFAQKKWDIPDVLQALELARDYDNFSIDITKGRSPVYEYMACLRHHAFPSPLLDWSRSRHVAAFFAFSKAEHDGRVSIYVLSESKLRVNGNGIPFIRRMGQYVGPHKRHFLQQSDYTLCMVYEGDSWQFAEHQICKDVHDGQTRVNRGASIFKYNIPVAEGIKVLRKLDEHNLNAFTLFGSEDSLMETLSARRFRFKSDNA